jgi:hypothetical protein
MENIEQKIKPSNWFTAMLFVFMAIIFLSAIIQYFSTLNIVDDNLVQISQREFVLSVVIDVLAYSYAFASIYNTLKAKPFSITMLKLSVVYILLQSIVRFIDNFNLVVQMPKLTLGWIAFLVIFLIYLFISKHLEEYIPKGKRKFGIAGFVGIIIYILVFATIAARGWDTISKTIASRPVDTNSVIINEYEVCDKIAAYRPLNDWQNDTIYGNNDDGYGYLFHSEKCNKIFVCSMCGDVQKRLDYYQMMYLIRQKVMPDTVKLYEVTFRDSVINGNKFYLNSYTFTDDSIKVFWTFAALKDVESYKITALSCFELDSLNESVKMATDFMKTVRFDLKD